MKTAVLKPRQRIRYFFIIFSFLSIPVTQFYFSPYLIVWGASNGVITASFFTFAFLFIGSLFVGRAFCGWVMPCAGMQESFFGINNNNPRTAKLNYLKFVIWVPWILSIITLALLSGGYKKVDYFFHLPNGISVSNVYMFIPYYSVILIFFFLSILFGKRASCHYICWMSPFMIIGRKISNYFNLPALRLKSSKDSCGGCGLCNTACPMSLRVSELVKKTNMENQECILCGVCADKCSKQVIKFYFGRL